MKEAYMILTEDKLKPIIDPYSLSRGFQHFKDQIQNGLAGVITGNTT